MRLPYTAALAMIAALLNASLSTSVQAAEQNWQVVDADSNVMVAVSQATWQGNWRRGLVRFAPLMATLPSFAGQKTHYLEVAVRCKYKRFIALAEGEAPQSADAALWQRRTIEETQWDAKAQTIDAQSGKNKLIFDALCGQAMPPSAQ